MKSILVLLFTSALIASAQTFLNVKFSPFTGAASNYTSTTNIAVGTNTLLTVKTIAGTDTITGGSASLQYVGSPVYPEDFFNLPGVPILGPCVLTLTLSASSSSASAHALLQFETVNTAPSPGGTAVQPAGFSSTIAVETSTNLQTWETLNASSFGKTNSARFFRLRQSIP